MLQDSMPWMQFQEVQDIHIPERLDHNSCAEGTLLAVEHAVFALVQFSSHYSHSQNDDGAHGGDLTTAHSLTVDPMHIRCKRVL